MLIPGKKIPSELIVFNGMDFIVHFLLFCFLSLVFLYERRKTRMLLPFGIFILIVIVYSILIEITQEIAITGRTGSYYDTIANILGLSALILNRMLFK